MLEDLIKQEAKKICKRLSDADIGSIRIDIEISGRTSAGDILINYRVGEQYGTEHQATAYAMEPAVDEFLRRRGWNVANAPKAITHSQMIDDEIPF